MVVIWLSAGPPMGQGLPPDQLGWAIPSASQALDPKNCHITTKDLVVQW